MSCGGPKFNIKITQNADETYAMEYTNSDDTPFDLTGSTLAMQVRESFDSVAISLTGTCTVTDAINGEFELSISGTDTLTLDTGRDYVYDIMLTDSFGEKGYLIDGTFYVKPSSTR